MINSGEFSAQNFQSIIENYEAALKDVTGELDSVQNEQKTIKRALSENNQLSYQLHKILAEKSRGDAEHQYKESDLIDNLKLQIKALNHEKEQTMELWQNAADTVEHLENELRVYQDNTQGLIPKIKLIELRNAYEEKLNALQATVIQTKTKLEETLNLKTKELVHKDKEISGSLQSQTNSFKIIKNLEDEVLNLQQRLTAANEEKCQLEKEVKSKNSEIEALKSTINDCRIRVQEALQVVDAALNEKDAALLREAKAKEEAEKLSQTLSDFIEETDTKIKSIQFDYQTKLEQLRQGLDASQELVKVKEMEASSYEKKCAMLEAEMEKLRNLQVVPSNDGSTSKMLILEKNLENTFQKLLLSEKQNIQLKAEIEALKADFEQMSHHYERDVNAKDAEKSALKKEISKLKMELEETYFKVSESKEEVNSLHQKISTMEVNFREQIKETKNSFQQTCMERMEMETVHNELVQELQHQIILQNEANKKWRSETKAITEQLEHVIIDLKMANTKIKQENKMLSDRLKDANMKMLEYRKFLEMISRDVTKITTITLPEISENTR